MVRGTNHRCAGASWIDEDRERFKQPNCVSQRDTQFGVFRR